MDNIGEDVNLDFIVLFIDSEDSNSLAPKIKVTLDFNNSYIEVYSNLGKFWHKFLEIRT